MRDVPTIAGSTSAAGVVLIIAIAGCCYFGYRGRRHGAEAAVGQREPIEMDSCVDEAPLSDKNGRESSSPSVVGIYGAAPQARPLELDAHVYDDVDVVTASNVALYASPVVVGKTAGTYDDIDDVLAR